jgi:hypothetical protein
MHSPLLGFLETAARVAEKLVLLAQHFTGGETAETGRDRGVLFNIDGQVEE